MDDECAFIENSITAGMLGKGKVFLILTSGRSLTLIMYYVPSLGKNLFWGGLLYKADMKLVFDHMFKYTIVYDNESNSTFAYAVEFHGPTTQ